MLKIAIDFDSTLFPTLEKVLEIYNKKHDANISLSQIVTYSLRDSLGDYIADELLDIFVDKTVYNNLQPYSNSIKTVKSLIEHGHDIYIATSSDIDSLRWKEQLLQKHFPFIPKKNLICIHNKSLLNVDVMIEDNMDNLMQTFADRICFNQPWNNNKEKDYVYSISRAYNWSDVINIINDIERKNKEWERQ